MLTFSNPCMLRILLHANHHCRLFSAPRCHEDHVFIYLSPSYIHDTTEERAWNPALQVGRHGFRRRPPRELQSIGRVLHGLYPRQQHPFPQTTLEDLYRFDILLRKGKSITLMMMVWYAKFCGMFTSSFSGHASKVNIVFFFAKGGVRTPKWKALCNEIVQRRLGV